MAAIDETHKTCKNCTKELPTTEFYSQVQNGANGQKWRYYDSLCKECRSTYSTDRRRLFKKQAVEYKGGSCEDCGLVDPCMDIYDFHHIDPSTKDFAISGCRSFEAMKPELDKCVLLCANCHRKRHSDS